jgi:hypothetical protein
MVNICLGGEVVERWRQLDARPAEVNLTSQKCSVGVAVAHM